ncbi:MAG: hypothetical protein IPK34_13065 [Ramlibacter sp.]|jgi:hypothetical protein|nr:hypothetical protein [Ramlibacter sp.]
MIFPIPRRPLLRLSGLLAASLALCACVTPYQPSGMTGGYRDSIVAPDTLRVSFGGNGYTSRETVQKYFYYRCAELTHQAGHKYFALRPVSRGISQVEPLGPQPVGTASAPPEVEKVAHWTWQAYVRMFTRWDVLREPSIGFEASEVLRVLEPFVRSEGKVAAELPTMLLFDPLAGPRALPADGKFDPDAPDMPSTRGSGRGPTMDDLKNLLPGGEAGK